MAKPTPQEKPGTLKGKLTGFFTKVPPSVTPPAEKPATPPVKGGDPNADAAALAAAKAAKEAEDKRAARFMEKGAPIGDDIADLFTAQDITDKAGAELSRLTERNVSLTPKRHEPSKIIVQCPTDTFMELARQAPKITDDKLRKFVLNVNAAAQKPPSSGAGGFVISAAQLDGLLNAARKVLEKPRVATPVATSLAAPIQSPVKNNPTTPPEQKKPLMPTPVLPGQRRGPSLAELATEVLKKNPALQNKVFTMKLNGQVFELTLPRGFNTRSLGELIPATDTGTNIERWQVPAAVYDAMLGKVTRPAGKEVPVSPQVTNNVRGLGGGFTNVAIQIGTNDNRYIDNILAGTDPKELFDPKALVADDKPRIAVTPQTRYLIPRERGTEVLKLQTSIQIP